MLKRILGFVSVASLLAVSQTVLAAVMATSAPADTTTAPLPQTNFNRQVVHHTPSNVATAQPTGVGYYFTSDDYHPYVGIETSYEYFQVPEFGMGSASNNGIQSKTVFNDTANQFVFIPKLYAGYHFQNHFLPMLFGQHADVEFNFSWFNTGRSDADGTTKNGATWKINPGDPGPQPTAVFLRNYQHRLFLRYRNVAVYFRGHNETSNPHLVMSPFVGAVYTYLDEQNRAQLDYSSDGSTWLVNKIDREDVSSNYYGLSFGNNLNYLFTTHLSSQLNIEAQVLRAVSNLDALQHPNLPANDNSITVHNTNAKYTYRAIVSWGMAYTFTSSPASPQLYANVGVDRWGYIGEIKNPRGTAETNKARIIDDANYNPFVTVGIRVPLVM